MDVQCLLLLLGIQTAQPLVSSKVLFTHRYTWQIFTRGKSIKPKILPCVTLGE